MSRFGAPAGMHYQFGPGGVTPAVRAILIACGVIFLLSLAMRDLVFSWLGLVPQSVVEGFALWQPVTYIFVHAGVFHLVFNMLGIWMFGVELERRWGTRAFTKYFFVCGVAAGVGTVAAGLLPVDALWRLRTYLGVTVGASGAFYGIAYAWARAFPHRNVLLFLIFPVPARWFVAILIAMDFSAAMQSGLTSNVAHIAHFAGLAAGYLYLNGGVGGGPGGLGAELKYRYLRWRMNRLRKQFDVHPGGRDKDRWVH